jgi:hypothetical protein
MKGFDTGNLQLDSSGEGDLVPIPKGTFQFQRGSLQAGMGLRLRIKIPDGTTGTGDLEGKQLTVSDIFDSQTKTNIIFGAQFADYISMGVNGVGISGGKPAKPRPCPGEEARALGLSSLAAETTSDEFLGPGEMLGLRKRF